MSRHSSLKKVREEGGAACPSHSPSGGEGTLQARLRQWCREGKISNRGNAYRLHETLVDKKPYSRKKELEGEIVRFAVERAFEGFKDVVFWESCDKKYRLNEIRFALEQMYEQGRLVRLNNGRYLTPQAMGEIKKQVEACIREKGRLSLESAKEILGYGRTGTVPVLEYLDAVEFTERREDVRVLKKWQ